MCCISGAAPLFLSDRAMQKILDRKTKPATYAMDLNLVGDYWGERTEVVVLVVPSVCQSSAMNGCHRSEPRQQSMNALLTVNCMVQGGSTSGFTTTLALCPPGELPDALPSCTPMVVITSLC